MTLRTRKLRAWMTLKGLTPKDVAKINGVSLRAVHRFVVGTMTSDRIRSWFASQGCPASHLPTAKPTTKTKMRKAA